MSYQNSQIGKHRFETSDSPKRKCDVITVHNIFKFDC